MGVAEESGELSHVFLKARQGIRGYNDPAKVDAEGKDAVGDTLIYLIDVCNEMGWDVQEVLETTAAHVLKRDWIADPKGGLIRSEDQQAAKIGPYVKMATDVQDGRPRIIGLSGKKRNGKDSAAKFLSSAGYVRYAFADKLKAAAKVIFGFSEEQVNGDLKEVIDPRWGESPRVVLQKFGTECMRHGYADDVWVRALEAELRDVKSLVAITDVRFPNEAEMVRALGGEVWRIVRPGFQETGNHASEVALDSYTFDRVLVADTLPELGVAVEAGLAGRGTLLDFRAKRSSAS